jgi:pyruvate dehydrogenase E2 component (dihydrolipoamide acetyltransferase)
VSNAAVDIEIVMPAVSPTMTHGTLVAQLKKTGEVVRSGDVIAEIEADKAIVELESEYDGIVSAWLVAEGTEEVPVDTPLLTLTTGTSADVTADIGQEAAPPLVPAGAEQPVNEPPAHNVVSLPAPEPTPEPAGAAAATALSAPTRIDALMLHAKGTPLSQALARQLNVAVAPVTTLLDGVATPVAPTQPNNTSTSDPRASGLRTPSPQTRNGEPDAGELAIQLGIPHERTSASSTRRVIAERMSQSKRDIPHFYLTSECSVDRLQQFRVALNDTEASQRISINDLLVRITALALKEHPHVNVAWIGPDMIHYERVDVAVAVATPGGLVTPVIRDAACSDLPTIASTMLDLGARARAGRLRPDEMAGGTITLSNLGMYGVREAVAVINPPQASILAVGTAEEQAVVDNGSLTVGRRMRCTLSVDHRAIDGAVAARFLATVKELVENPETLA